MGIFVPIFMLAFFVGVFFVQTADLTATTRNDAWRKRYTEAKSEEYNFQAQQTLMTAAGDREITVVAFLRSFAKPKSKHAVLGDPWDARPDTSPAAKERFDELNEHWNFELQGELAALAGANSVSSALGALSSAASALDSAASAAASIADALVGGYASQLEDLQKSAQEQLDKQIEAEKQKLRDQIAELDRQIDQLQQGIDAAIKQRDAAQTRIGEIDRELQNPDLMPAQRDALDLEKKAKEIEVTNAKNAITLLTQQKTSREKSRSALQKALNS